MVFGMAALSLGVGGSIEYMQKRGCLKRPSSPGNLSLATAHGNTRPLRANFSIQPPGLGQPFTSLLNKTLVIGGSILPGYKSRNISFISVFRRVFRLIERLYCS